MAKVHIVNCFLTTLIIHVAPCGVFAAHLQRMTSVAEPAGSTTYWGTDKVTSGGRASVAGPIQMITTEDLVRFVTIGNPQSLDWKGQYRLAEDVGDFSPDGELIAVVVGGGNPEKGTNDATILVYRTDDLLRHYVHPDAVVRFASSTNYQPIAFARWLADSETLVFAGTRDEQLSQVYRFNLRIRKLSRVTHESTQLLWYDITPSGQTLVALTSQPWNPPAASDVCKYRGCRITANALWNAEDGVPNGSAVVVVYDLRTGQRRELPNPEAKDTKIKRCDDSLPGGISPDGRFAVRACEVSGEWPAWWGLYTRSSILRECWKRRNTGWPNSHCGRVLTLVNLETGGMTTIGETPFIPWSDAEPIWIDDGRYLILPGVVEPRGGAGGVERGGGTSGWVSVLINTVTQEVAPIGKLHLDAANVSGASWEASTQTLTVETQNAKGMSLPAIHFHRAGGRWTASEPSLAALSVGLRRGIQLTIRESLNDAPVLMVHDRTTSAKWCLLDPNPWLAKRQLGHVEEVSWTSEDGRIWKGGLYYPPNYSKGARYPLVLQTHGFRPGQFSLHGIARVFAAQALAAHGIVVLQIQENFLDVINTPLEWTTVQAGYEAAIDYLDSLGIIDRQRVGIQGWSRTGPHVGYTITHSVYPFAAAALTESGDFGWLWYLSAGAPPAIDGLFGSPPFGDGLDAWRQYSPTFNLDRVRTPMLMWEARSVVGLWDWYVGLRRLGKPVEYWFLPDGVHDVFQVGQRVHTNQLLVDWFRFWLKDEEDLDPTKADQYARWREFRSRQEAARAENRGEA